MGGAAGTADAAGAPAMLVELVERNESEPEVGGSATRFMFVFSKISMG